MNIHVVPHLMVLLLHFNVQYFTLS